MRIDTVNEITRVDFLQVPAWLREAIFPTTSSVEENLISQYVGDSTESCHVSPRSINTFDRRRLSVCVFSKVFMSVKFFMNVQFSIIFFAHKPILVSTYS